MLTATGQQILLMVTETIFVGVLLLASFRFRRVVGAPLMYIAFGVIFQYANLLAGSIYVQLTPWLVVSPGSVVLFPAILFLVLFVYLTDDTVEARKLIYSVAIANIVFVPLTLLVSLQMKLPGIINPNHLSADVFAVEPRIVIGSAVVVFLDTLLICVLYELVSRVTRVLFFRVFVSLLATLYFDAIAFATAAFAGSPFYHDIMISQLAGKTVAALIYATILSIYLRSFERADGVRGEGRELGATFRVLTYRQRYEELQRIAIRDALTGVYNRGFFDETVQKDVALANRTNRPLCLMMIDIDHFKAVNDTYGHVEGDKVLQLLAASLVASVRGADYVCRYGGEEFTILLPQTDIVQAQMLADRIVSELPQALSTGWAGAGTTPITATIGVAEAPREARDGLELVRVADRRLYAGKAAGRNRVVTTDDVTVAAPS